MGILLIPGTSWAMTRETKFRISHMLLAVFFYCALLIPLKLFLIDKRQEVYSFLFFAICLVPLTAGGIPVGLTTESVIPEDQPRKRKVFLFAGFLTPVSLIFFILSPVGLMLMLVDRSRFKGSLILIPIWLLSSAPIALSLYGKYLKSKR
jgi:hypothetical protein